MTTPAPAQLPGEPFSEALSEAAQAAAMSVRLILTIADAVRRASQKHHHGKEQDLSEDFGQIAESGGPPTSSASTSPPPSSTTSPPARTGR